MVALVQDKQTAGGGRDDEVIGEISRAKVTVIIIIEAQQAMDAR